MLISPASAFCSEWICDDCYLQWEQSLHLTPLGIFNPCLVVTDCPVTSRRTKAYNVIIYLFSPAATSEVREGIIPFLHLSPRFIELEIIISRINQLRNRPRSLASLMLHLIREHFSSKWTSHDCHLNMGQSPHPTPLSIFNPCPVNPSWQNRKQLKLLPVDMFYDLEFRMVTHAAWERVSFKAFTFTTPLLWYSFQFASSKLNRSLYEVTHWKYMVEDLPCVAILFTTLSFPRSICKYCPIAFEPDDQEPLLPFVLILLRRACHGSCSGAQTEDAFTASFGISLFSIPRGWMRHSVCRKTNSFLFTLTCWSNSNQA